MKGKEDTLCCNTESCNCQYDIYKILPLLTDSQRTANSTGRRKSKLGMKIPWEV